MPTEILAFVIFPASFLELIKSITSGCHTFKISIKAPLLEPPCSINPVTKLYKDAHETAPDDLPFTPFTYAYLGRRVDTLIPTPPPLDMISAIWLKVSKIPCLESFGDGIT